MLAQGRPFDALMLVCVELVEMLRAGLSLLTEKSVARGHNPGALHHQNNGAFG
jgi:hypothetical protein